MLSVPRTATGYYNLMAQAELSASVFENGELELWPYRSRTMALLRRYARASVEVGRLPSFLGREFFRSRVTSRSKRGFEDTVVFVADIERTLDELDALERRLVTMHVIEEYTIVEVSRQLMWSEKTVERLLHDAIDQTSRLLLARKLLERIPETRVTFMTPMS